MASVVHVHPPQCRQARIVELVLDAHELHRGRALRARNCHCWSAFLPLCVCYSSLSVYSVLCTYLQNSLTRSQQVSPVDQVWVRVRYGYGYRYLPTAHAWEAWDTINVCACASIQRSVMAVSYCSVASYSAWGDTHIDTGTRPLISPTSEDSARTLLGMEREV